MSFRKRETSKVVEKATLRLSGMKEIDKQRGKLIDYGGEDNVITSSTVEEFLGKVKSNTDLYNQALQQADALGNLIEADEAKLNTLLVGVLKGASTKFGEDSNEVEKLGGTRKSDRKKVVRKVKVA